MAEEAADQSRRDKAVLGPLPPHVQLFDFLPEAEHRALLAWAIANQGLFWPATVHDGKASSKNRVDPGRRVALTTRTLDGIDQGLKARLGEAFGKIAEATGYRGPPPTSLELEVAAHGDGAHFAPHVDIPIGPNRMPLSGNPKDDRVLSAVYYFYAQPKAFTGGELRLFRFGAEPEAEGRSPENHVDVQPVDNSLVAFPSWVAHEVRRVSCPGAGFGQYRFALNCWYCRPLGDKGRTG